MSDLSIIATDVIELYKQGIPGAMDAGVPRRLAEAVLEHEAVLREALSYIGVDYEEAPTDPFTPSFVRRAMELLK